MKISIVIPTLNEAKDIQKTLALLQPLRERGHEIIISDGGSTDNTTKLAASLADKIISSAKSRASQMNTGAKKASGDILWFLHADTFIPENSDIIIRNHLQNSNKVWGRFNIRLSGQHFLFRIIERMVNLRSKLTGIATGDQGIFIRQEYFKKLNGFSEIPLMEDIEISTRLKSFSSPICLTQKLITSSRRWEKHGILKTVFLMWQLRLAYFMGTSANKLARKYH